MNFVDKSAIKFPLATEMAVVVLFMGAWLFPVIASWGVALTGRKFSYVAPHFQSQNVEIVGMCILVALASGIVAAVVALSCLDKMSRFRLSITMVHKINGAQRFFLISVALIAAIGLFKSFGGTIFEKSYEGPSIAWLGYGAWSVTFLLSINLLVGDFIATRSFKPAIVVVLSTIFLPFLLSGSRIDFLSSMLVLVAYMLFLHNAKLGFRVLWALAILAWAAIVVSFIGQARYVFFDTSLSFSPFIPVGIVDGMIYLSTFGDLGASVFQIVGLVQGQIDSVVGMETAALTYAARLLPGPFFSNRPGDFWLTLSEPIGGGALHSLGEGYLIFGLAGCALMGVIFGVLAAISIFAGNYFRSTGSPVWWVIFAFPWLLLIRGGWYQFFSILKSIEVLVFLFLLLAAIEWMRIRYLKYDSSVG